MFDLVIEAVGDGTVQGVVVDHSGSFVEAFPRTFEIGDKLEVNKDAIFILRRGDRQVGGAGGCMIISRQVEVVGYKCLRILDYA